MAVITLHPIEEPAKEASVYDKVWYNGIHILAPDVNGDAVVEVYKTLYRELPDGSREIAPNTTPVRNDVINIFSQSQYNPTQISVLQDIITNATFAELLGLTQVILFATLQKHELQE